VGKIRLFGRISFSIFSSFAFFISSNLLFQTVKLFENLSLSPILSAFRLVNIKNICSIIANEDKTIGIDKNSF